MVTRRALVAAIATSWLAAGCGAVDPPAHLAATRAVVEAAGDPVNLFVTWRVDVGSANVLEEPIPQTGGIAVSPDGSVIFAALADGTLTAFRANDGARLWSAALGGSPTGAPAWVDGALVVGAPDGSLRALDAGSGSERWRVSAPGSLGSAPTIADGVAYIVTSNARLLAVDVATGQVLWTFDRPPSRTIAMVGQSGVRTDGDAACAGFSDGSLACVNTADGSSRWVADLTHGARRLTDVDTTPSRIGDLWIAASFDGGVSGHAVDDGEERWHLPVRGATTVVPVDDLAVTTTVEGAVLWLDPATGEVVRSLELEARGLLPAVPHPSGLLVGGASGGLYAIAHNVPWILNRFDPGSAISALPTVFGTSVYLLTDGGYLYRLDLTGR